LIERYRRAVGARDRFRADVARLSSAEGAAAAAKHTRGENARHSKSTKAAEVKAKK
jgi:hypothetical protein